MKGQSSFHAHYTGKCKGCRRLYRPGDNIWSPGEGGEAYHIKCQPSVVRRFASEEDLESLRLRSRLKKAGIYSS